MYGKVFDSIYDGTLYGNWEAIATFQQFIVLANADGVVDMTPQAIAARTSFPLDLIQRGIKFLEAPDPYSRTPGDEGRRIVLMDPENRPWGWRIVNHGKYMRLRNMAQKREADRVRIAEKRLEIKDVASESHPVANVAHEDVDVDIDVEKQKRSQGSRLLPAWQPSELLKTWAQQKRPDLDVGEMVEKFRDHWCAISGRAGVKTDWDATFRNWIRGERSGSLKAVPSAPATQVLRKPCDYCQALSTGNVNGRNACGEHWQSAMDNLRPMGQVRGG